MLDPLLAERLAVLLAGGPGTTEDPPRELTPLCADAGERVVAYTGLRPAGPLPDPEWVDRATWARVNVTSLRAMLDPLSARLGERLGAFGPPARAGLGVVAAAEAGALLGLLGRRVLGQLDIVLLEPDVPTRLLFVAPNLRDAARALDADPGELLAWVAFHEVTHAVQFASVGWLRPRLAALVGELLDSLQLAVDPERLRRARAADLRSVLAAVREGGLAAAVSGAAGAGVLERVQATMALVEGHAEHVMDVVGAQTLGSLPELRAALDRRRRERPPAFRLLERLLGLDLKLRQYEEGKRFCDAVVAAAGPPALERAWSSPEAAPTLTELRDPARWLIRAT